MGMTSIVAQKHHVPFDNMNLQAAADWEMSTVKKLGWLASKDPFVLLEGSFESGFGRVTEDQRLLMGTENMGHCSNLRSAWEGRVNNVLWMES